MTRREILALSGIRFGGRSLPGAARKGSSAPADITLRIGEINLELAPGRVERARTSSVLLAIHLGAVELRIGTNRDNFNAADSFATKSRR
jgi:hypothetical protein